MRAAGLVWISLAVLPALAAPTQQVVLDVKGMDCAACPITVKAVLRKQPGVEEAKVDLEKQIAEVRFDAAKVTPDKLAAAVSEAGFPASPRK
ncbi:MAG TPA: cation transporter [Usitatibacter sp.]|jgi:periplasmic mercuric ion binding protein|nr:cation transporter [Usitatibacter sp.]